MAANLNQVVSDVVELMQSRAKDLGVELFYRPGEPMPQLIFDPEGMHRAVLNVVTNAIDAAAESSQEDPGEEDVHRQRVGRVEVATCYLPETAHLQVLVSDNGPGIPAEHLSKLFSPFVSFKGGRGTGLGLPVSQKILTEHGGRILVNSTPGDGSRFTLEIPAVQPGTGSPTQA